MDSYFRDLCSLHLNIAHEEKGNFTKMNNIMNRCGILNHSRDKFFNYNLFQALNLDRIIDVSWDETGIRWAVNPEAIKKDSRWVFGEQLLNSGNITKSLFKDLPLTFEKSVPGKTFDNFEDFCAFPSIVDSGVIKENTSILASIELEIYQPEINKWEFGELKYDESELVRVSDRFCGFRYYVYEKESGLVFRITIPEWMFVISAYLLNWDIEKILIYENQNLTVNSSFRLPSAVARYLYSHCKEVQFDYQIKYRELENQHVEKMKFFISPRESV